jgi:hypothetical protein
VKKKKTKKQVFEPVYSGNKSKVFWDKVWKMAPNDINFTLAYLIGCVLQNFEREMLNILNALDKQTKENK